MYYIGESYSVHKDYEKKKPTIEMSTLVSRPLSASVYDNLPLTANTPNNLMKTRIAQAASAARLEKWNI